MNTTITNATRSLLKARFEGKFTKALGKDAIESNGVSYTQYTRAAAILYSKVLDYSLLYMQGRPEDVIKPARTAAFTALRVFLKDYCGDDCIPAAMDIAHLANGFITALARTRSVERAGDTETVTYSYASKVVSGGTFRARLETLAGARVCGYVVDVTAGKDGVSFVSRAGDALTRYNDRMRKEIEKANKTRAAETAKVDPARQDAITRAVKASDTAAHNVRCAEMYLHNAETRLASMDKKDPARARALADVKDWRISVKQLKAHEKDAARALADVARAC